MKHQAKKGDMVELSKPWQIRTGCSQQGLVLSTDDAFEDNKNIAIQVMHDTMQIEWYWSDELVVISSSGKSCKAPPGMV